MPRNIKGVLVWMDLEMTGLDHMSDVIVEIDGQPVRNENDYADVLEQHSAGDTVKVKTVRDNQIHEYDIRLLSPRAR